MALGFDQASKAPRLSPPELVSMARSKQPVVEVAVRVEAVLSIASATAGLVLLVSRSAESALGSR